MTEPEGPHIIAGDNAVLARRYAHALYELAEEKNQLDAVADDLRAFRNVVKDDAVFQRMVRNPRLSRAQLAKTMQQIASQIELNETAALFLSLLAHKRRLEHLNDIIGVFLNELAIRRNEHVVEVFTPRPLSPAQQEKLTAQIQKLSGGSVRLLIKEDASLLGGMAIKWGSRLLDVTLKGKLAQLERELKMQQEAA